MLKDDPSCTQFAAVNSSKPVFRTQMVVFAVASGCPFQRALMSLIVAKGSVKVKWKRFTMKSPVLGSSDVHRLLLSVEMAVYSESVGELASFWSPTAVHGQRSESCSSASGFPPVPSLAV